MLQVVVPPATPAGQYEVESVLRGADGRLFAAKLPVRVEAFTIPKSNSGKVPVILLNGWQFDCSDQASTLTASENTFGNLDSQLQSLDIPAAFFNNCAYGAAPIEDLGAQLGAFISNLTYSDGTSVSQVDLIAHSMGGLIARAYLAGLQSNGTLTPPLNPQVRKLIEIATPNFGSFQASTVGSQLPEMLPGSPFLWNLANWNQDSDDLRGVDALAIIGNGGTWTGSPIGVSDGVVSVTSASLGFARDLSRTQILPYCHIDTTLGNPVGYQAYLDGEVTCSGYGIANTTEAPETGQLILSFLAAASGWSAPTTHPKPNSTPAQDPYLSKYGGIYFAVVNPAGQYLSDLNQVSFGSQVNFFGNGKLQGGPSGATISYADFVEGSGDFQATSITAGSLTCGPFSVPAGYYVAVRCKASTAISSVTPLDSSASGAVVASGATISINGAGFGTQCPTCVVLANGAPLQVSSWADSITAFLPATYNGLVTLVVQSTAGQDSINIMARPLTATCSYGLNLGGQGFSSQGGSGTINIATAANCPWSISNLPSWISLTGPTSGAGTGTISFNAAPDSAGDLSGTFDIGGQAFTVEETAAAIPELTSAGSLAQVASQGGWSFTLDAINLGSSAATARFNFADNKGSPLGLPLIFPQSSTMSGPLLAATLDRTLKPNAQVLMGATGPTNSTPVQGWGQLLTNGGISGFGIFSNSAYHWNAVVPLETRNAGSYILAFDNTGSLSTGVAIANVAAAGANVNVVVRDDQGRQIGTHLLGLSPLGHASFMLTQYPETARIRGTVEFDTPSGGQISVLGLRANGPALTTLPVLAGGSAGGGSIAHVTYDGGYTSTFYLVNTGTTPSPFTLSFFDESGNPLATPLVQPQSETVPEISGTLAPGATTVVEAQGQDSLPSIAGSAQLVSSGNVSGFEIFRSTVSGQEASVPLETRTPNSFVLVFDNTNGLTTGVALANSATEPANVTLNLLDDQGKPLGTQSISLAPRGHTSFMLPDTYNLTQNQRGMAEFVVPAGGAISVIGLRAKSDGTLTTIPVIAR